MGERPATVLRLNKYGLCLPTLTFFTTKYSVNMYIQWYTINRLNEFNYAYITLFYDIATILQWPFADKFNFFASSDQLDKAVESETGIYGFSSC